MFKVGKKYKVRFIENGGEVAVSLVIERYEHPLIEFTIENDSEPESMILNVTSPHFLSAIPDTTRKARWSNNGRPLTIVKDSFP